MNQCRRRRSGTGPDADNNDGIAGLICKRYETKWRRHLWRCVHSCCSIRQWTTVEWTYCLLLFQHQKSLTCLRFHRTHQTWDFSTTIVHKTASVMSHNISSILIASYTYVWFRPKTMYYKCSMGFGIIYIIPRPHRSVTETWLSSRWNDWIPPVNYINWLQCMCWWL